MTERIAIVRTPNGGGYVIIDRGGIPHTVGKWKAAVQVLHALTLKENNVIEAMKAEIDAGKTKHLQARLPGN
jgi:hypothetical protein